MQGQDSVPDLFPLWTLSGTINTVSHTILKFDKSVVTTLLLARCACLGIILWPWGLIN